MKVGRFCLLLAVVIWGWTFVATKVCLAYLSPLEIMGLRFLIALPVLLGLLLARRIRIRVDRDRGRLLLASSLISLHFFIQITGLLYTSATHTGWIIAISPLVIAVLALAVLREPIRARMAVGILVGTAGILLLVSGGRLAGIAGLSSRGDWLVLLSAHTWALYTIGTRDLSRRHHPLSVTFLILLPATLVSLALMAARFDWSRLGRLPVEALAALLFLGVLGMGVAQWFWQEGVARVGASEAGVFLYLEPLATTGLAVPYLGERLHATTIAGGAMVLAAVWYAQSGGSASRMAPEPEAP